MIKKIFVFLSNILKEKTIQWLLNENSILENRIFDKLLKKKIRQPHGVSYANWIRDSDCFIISTQKFFVETHGYHIPLSNQLKFHKMHYLEEIFFHVGSIEYWCEENCAGQWGIVSDEIEYRFYFQDQIDAMAFKLVWM